MKTLEDYAQHTRGSPAPNVALWPAGWEEHPVSGGEGQQQAAMCPCPVDIAHLGNAGYEGQDCAVKS